MASSTSSQNSRGPKRPRGRTVASSRRPERARCWRFTAPRTDSGTTKEQKPSLVLVSRNAGDIHVYRHGRCSVAISAAGGLEALQFVQCFVEAALYAGFVTGELGEGVRAVAVPYERQTERIRVQIPHISVGLLHEYACLHPAQSPKPPVGGDDPIDEEVLQLSDRLKLGPQVFVQLPQRLLVLSRQQNLLGAQAVPERI